MSHHILNYFGQINGAFIHARGRAATLKIIELLDCKPDESILELGFGTGATLTYLSSVYKHTGYTGYDASPVMFDAAVKRLKFCSADKNVKLKLIQPGQIFPDHSNSFDKIFAESVLAIQENDQLKDVLVDLKRLLKHNGELIFNETIWLDSVSKEEAEKINLECKKAFGIIQANAKYTHLNNWTSLLKELGFEVELVFHANSLKNQRFVYPGSWQVFLSELLTVQGKFKAVFSPKLTKEWKKFTHDMSQIIPPGRQYMEGVIIKARNVKNDV
ncbi:MAG: class I SAM-dependent methyltransferase [Bacteroidetes bacterium]|nr:class I SAM-dependent methyltransferase [Bacteroidota bacterium]